MPPTRPARLTALALLAACCAAFAPVPVYREPVSDRRTDEQRLQGTWEVVSLAPNGVVIAATGRDGTAVFAGGRLSLLTRGKAANGWSFTVDPAASTKRMDLRDGEGTLLRCVYRLEGDRLTLAYVPRTGAARPTDLKGGPGVWVSTYRRVKRAK